MLKKSITYTDFNDRQITEVFYFNLTRTELLKMELSEDNGFGEMLQRIVDAKNNGQIVKVFEEIILMSYGEKTQDGKSFEKFDANGHPLSQKFAATAAFDALFFEFVENQAVAEEFIRGIMPANVPGMPAAPTESAQDGINKALAQQGLPALTPEQFQPMAPPPPPVV